MIIRPIFVLLAAVAAVILPAQAGAEQPRPPQAKRVFQKLEKHGVTRVDPYYWLKERDNPEVLAYLKAENEYAEAMLKPVRRLRRKLFAEFKSRIKENEASAPVRSGPYVYYTRYQKGKEYSLHCRRRGGMDGAEEVLLDVNKLAKGHKFFQLGAFEISDDHNLAAYSFDTEGRRIHTIRVRDLRTGKDLPDRIEKVTSNAAWAADNKTLFYTKQDSSTLRADEIYRHTLGGAQDELVYREQDETFSVSVFRTLSKRHLLIPSQATLTTEWRYLPAAEPDSEPRLFAARRRGHEYSVSHGGDRWYVLSNDGARNFKLMEAPEDQTEEKHWRELVAHRQDVFISGFAAFKDYLVLQEQENALNQLRVLPRGGGAPFRLDFPDQVYSAMLGHNEEYDAAAFRHTYESLTTPFSQYDFDPASRRSVLVKRKAVLGGFRAENYDSRRVWATAADGAKIPVNLVHKKGIQPDGKNPLLLYGYGSYGVNLDPWFSAQRLSWLDRGGVYAIAQTRGGQDLGRKWYEDGRQMNKWNTFNDFIAAAEHLQAAGWADPARTYAEGGSAGGLLMGAVANKRPDLFHGQLVEVPFVDVVTTMLDDSIPLTTSEYDEWGNPNEKPAFDYMLSYSPYDNIEAKDYPHLLVTAGLTDSQVQYWEPAKYAARLRARKTGDSQLLLWTEMKAGHSGQAGRYESLKLLAMEYAWFMGLAGLDKR
ncbi:MAG: S9 family peptidase [Elusimicrobiota bacterium]